jgi:hypothetical protein
MADEIIKKKNFKDEEVEILGATYEQGKPNSPLAWRRHLSSRKEMIAYLKTAERYWFSDDWYGSERRKKKA